MLYSFISTTKVLNKVRTQNKLDDHISTLVSTNTETENYSSALSYAQTYRPIYYFHKSEKAFPTKLEKWNKNWNTIADSSTGYLSSSYKGPTSLQTSNNDVAIYASVNLNAPGNTVTITYNLLYGWNGCGPRMRLRGKIWKLDVDVKLSVCDLGVHYGDNQYVTVTVNKSNGNVITITNGVHSDTWVNSASDASFSGRRVRIFVALGSHSQWVTPGEKRYHMIKDGKKKIGFTMRYEVSLYDFPPNGTSSSSSIPWNPNSNVLRILKINGSEYSGATTGEKKFCCRWNGKLGPDYKATNNGIGEVRSTINTLRKACKKVNWSSCKRGFDDAKDWLNENTTSGSSGGLIKKDWF